MHLNVRQTLMLIWLICRFFHVQKSKSKYHAKKHFFFRWFGECCTFLYMEQLDWKHNSVHQFALKKCRPVLLFHDKWNYSGPEACSGKLYAALLVQFSLQKLDDVLKELHGSHNIFILLASFYEFLYCHHSILVTVHFLEEFLHMFTGGIVSYTG